MLGPTLKLIAVILPLGLDTLGVSLALGVTGIPPRRRLQLSLLFAAFEAGMPLVGVALGIPLGRAVGRDANYFAAGLIVAVGIYMLVARDGDDERGHGPLLVTKRGLWAALALGVSISVDEVAIGFSAGLLRLPIVELVIAVGVQAFIFTQVAVRLGGRIGARWREGAEKLAGVALVLLGAVLLVEQLGA